MSWTDPTHPAAINCAKDPTKAARVFGSQLKDAFAMMASIWKGGGRCSVAGVQERR